MNLEHAEHNEALCHKLHSEGKWNDWVVTTAFYAALHYIEKRLFPLKVKNAEYQNFDEYYPQRTDHSKNQHEARLKLVHERLRKAHSAYRFLLDSCRTARYYDYKTTPAIADSSKLKLAVVKSLCIPTKPTTITKPTTSTIQVVQKN